VSELTEPIPDPPLIAYLRKCSTDPRKELAATIRGRSCAGLGIRPRLLADGGSENVYGLTGGQVAKLLKKYDEAIGNNV
jgi:hypothetical protein